MALPSFVKSTPRAYWLKAGNADLRYFNMLRDIPSLQVAQAQIRLCPACRTTSGCVFVHWPAGA
jgi:hypothetical protein